MNTDTMPPARVRHAHRTGFVAWGLLGVLQVLWHGWWAPPETGSPALAAGVALLPLLLPLVALRRPPRALLCAGMIALFYFCHGVMEAWSVPLVRLPAMLEIGLSVVLILALGGGVYKRRSKTASVESTGSRHD